MYSLVGVDMILLEEVCHLGWALRSQMLKSSPVSFFLFLLPVNLDVELLVPLQYHVCLCASMLPAMTIMV